MTRRPTALAAYALLRIRVYFHLAVETDEVGQLRRVVVIGSSGAGKTTLAAALAGRLGVPHVELDSLFWGPSWTALGGSPEGDARFRNRILAATAGGAWVVDGNYSSVATGVLWPRADAIVWLDYPLPLVFLRLLRRSLRRLLTRELLWGTNRESVRELFLSRDSLLLFLLRTHRQRRRRFAARLAQPDLAPAAVVRLRSPAQAGAWLRTLPAAGIAAVPAAPPAAERPPTAARAAEAWSDAARRTS